METSEWLGVDADDDLQEALKQAKEKLVKFDIPEDPEIFFDEIAHVLDAATTQKEYEQSAEIVGVIFSKHRALFDQDLIYYLNWITESLLALNQKDKLGPYMEAALKAPSEKLAQDFLFKILPRLMRAGCFEQVAAILSCHLRPISEEGAFFPESIEELNETLSLAAVYAEYDSRERQAKQIKASELESAVRDRLSGAVDLSGFSYLSAMLRILSGESPEPAWKREDFLISLSDRKKEETVLRQRLRELGTYFLLWLVRSKGFALGLGDAYCRAALGYLSHQEVKKNSSCFLSIETVKIEESLAALTRGLFAIDREMLGVYLEALPLFSAFLAERNLIEAGESHNVAQKAARLKRLAAGENS